MPPAVRHLVDQRRSHTVRSPAAGQSQGLARLRLRRREIADWRRTHPDFTTNLDTNLRTVDRLRAVADAHGTTVGAVAIAWVLARRGVTGAIAGARRPEQTADWERAATLQLTEQELEFVAAE